MSKYFPNFFFTDSGLFCCCWLVFPQGLHLVLPHIATTTQKTMDTHRTTNQNIVMARNFLKNNKIVAILHRLDRVFKSNVIDIVPPRTILPDVHGYR